MPRPANPMNEARQLRQSRYRVRLEDKGEPEASLVDTAVAGAFAAFAHAIVEGMGSRRDREVMNVILLGAVDMLVAEGYDRKHITRVFRRRISPDARKTLKTITESSGVRNRLRLSR